MRDSVVFGNGSGIITSSSQVYFTVEGSTIDSNTTVGLKTNSTGAIVDVGGSTIGGNAIGVLATAGLLISFGDNQMSANATNRNFTSTTSLQ